MPHSPNEKKGQYMTTHMRHLQIKERSNGNEVTILRIMFVLKKVFAVHDSL